MEKVGKMLRKKLVSEITDSIEQNQNTFLLNFSSLNSTQMGEMRKSLKRLGARVYISKNRIAGIALKQANGEGLASGIQNQTAFVWSNEDSVAVSKAVVKFAEDFESLVIGGGLLDGEVLKKEDIKRLSELPTKEVLVSQLLATMLSPLTRLAGALNAKSRDLLSILKQLSEKKQE